MKPYLQMFLILSFVFSALAFCNVGVASACDESGFEVEPKPIPAPAKATNEQNGRFLKCGSSMEAREYTCASEPLREKPRPSAGPIIWAVALAGTAIVIILRKRKASMMILGASLVGLFAAIGYLWRW